jgi:hypothetical protein
MPARSSRRKFLQTTSAAGGAIGLGGWAALLPFSPAWAEEATATPDQIRFSPEIEPIVRLIETTPRHKCIPTMVEQLRRGLPYRRFLAALYLAAVRAADYHAGVHGFDHNAYSIYSAHQLTLELPVSERLLPAFWALDSFKGTLQRFPDRQPTPGFRGGEIGPEQAAENLCAGIEEWDRERAERGVVSLVRSQKRQRVTELLLRYAARDRFFIGHLAILVSNSCRLLETIGWQTPRAYYATSSPA